MNTVCLLGRLTKDVDLSFIAGSGKAVARFSIAVKRPFKKDESDFLNCVVFGKPAETLSQYVFKGDMLGITGSIRNNNYKRNDGTMVYNTEILVESFDFIRGSKGTSNKTDNNLDDLQQIENNDLPF